MHEGRVKKPLLGLRGVGDGEATFRTTDRVVTWWWLEKILLYVMSIQICPERIPQGKLFHYLPPHTCNLGLNFI